MVTFESFAIVAVRYYQAKKKWLKILDCVIGKFCDKWYEVL